MASLKQLSDLKAKDEAGYETVMRWRDGAQWLGPDGKPATFTVYGSEAPTYLKRRAEFYREVANQGKEADTDFIAAGITACAIKGWTLEEPCTVENARALMAFEFLRTQVETAATPGAGFFGAGSTDSSGG